MASITAPKSPPMSDGNLNPEARFSHFAKNLLGLDSNALSGALRLFRETKHLHCKAIGSVTPEEAERFWFAFVLYSSQRLGLKDESQRGSENGGISLCKILRASKLTVQGFFKEIPQFLVRAGSVLSSIYGPDWEKRLEVKELQANFDVLDALSEFYKRAYLELFITNDIDENPTGSLSEYHRFGWLLFLAFRTRVLSHWQDLVTLSTCLVSILAVLIIHVPVRFRKFSINDFPSLVKKEDKTVDLVASLCNNYDCSEEDLKKRMEDANSLIEKMLKKKARPPSDCKSENLEHINLDGMTYFEDLMDSSLPSTLEILEVDYSDAIRNKCELDERVFINKGDSLLESGSSSGESVNMTGVKRKLDIMSSPTKTVTSLLSPHHSPSSHTNQVIDGPNTKVPATPVSTALTTAKWLRTVISPLPSKPSPELERFLVSCDKKDVKSDVRRRADIILGAIFPSSTPGDQRVTGSLRNVCLFDKVWAEQRRLEALKFYFRVLEAMCRAEAQIPNASNLTSLLTNERFHRCMLACSAELVLATHKSFTVRFPTVLERTGITAFDLCKVIESFIRHEDSLPRELRRHLNSLEERLLESMVWEKGSSMYDSLTVARPALSTEITELGLMAKPMPPLNVIALRFNISVGTDPPQPTLRRHETSPASEGDMRSPKRMRADYRSVLVERNSFTSPKPKPPPLQSAFASPTRPNPGGGGERCAETGINVFFSKITKLAAVRINVMAERFQLSQQIREKVYVLFQQILRQETALFFSRHIDQIILSSFFGVVKVFKLNLTFTEMIHDYMKQSHCKSEVCNRVLSKHPTGEGSAGKHLNIIKFYNHVFMPTVKYLLEELPAGATSSITNRAPEANTTNDAQCPGSPKVSPFPCLPDMSPKKVSASHNVYVSPLRSSKMDALISHSSKSYYACIGESTHEYQSPSKDLSAINNRLNNHSPRKVRGSRNFDDVDIEFVSDTMVANSLYLHNGSAASSSGAHLKTEQQDSILDPTAHNGLSLGL